MNEYSGVHGDFHWEWRAQTLHVFSAKPRIGVLRTFENVVAQNSEQAQWARPSAHRPQPGCAVLCIEAEKAAALANTAAAKP